MKEWMDDEFSYFTHVQVKGTVLEDNDPMDNYRYLLCVCTGHRIGASTSSQVVKILICIYLG